MSIVKLINRDTGPYLLWIGDGVDHFGKGGELVWEPNNYAPTGLNEQGPWSLAGLYVVGSGDPLYIYHPFFFKRYQRIDLPPSPTNVLVDDFSRRDLVSQPIRNNILSVPFTAPNRAQTNNYFNQYIGPKVECPVEYLDKSFQQYTTLEWKKNWPYAPKFLLAGGVWQMWNFPPNVAAYDTVAWMGLKIAMFNLRYCRENNLDYGAVMYVRFYLGADGGGIDGKPITGQTLRLQYQLNKPPGGWIDENSVVDAVGFIPEGAYWTTTILENTTVSPGIYHEVPNGVATTGIFPVPSIRTGIGSTIERCSRTVTVS